MSIGADDEREPLAKGPKCPGCRQVPTRDELSDPSVWGRAWWTSMLATAYAYPDAPTAEERECYSNYFNTVSKVLPCPKCRGHFAELLKEHPVEPHLSSGAQLREWLIARKNDVNKRLGKDCPTTQHVCKTWKQKLYRRRAKTWTTVGVVLGSVALAILLAVLFFFLGKRQAEKKRALRFEGARSDGNGRLPPSIESAPPTAYVGDRRPYPESGRVEETVSSKPSPRRNVSRSYQSPRGALVESYVPQSY